MRRVSVFGATGSVGQNTIDLIARSPEEYDVVALTGAANIDQLAKDAIKLNADSSRIVLMGHSAGCHLATLATLADAARPVRALICNDTRAYDIPFLARISGGGLPSLYVPAFRDHDMWKAWSPISYTGLKQQPPTMVAWSGGTRRDVVSMRFADTLERDGGKVTRFDGSRNYNHFSINRKIGAERDGLTRRIDRFLETVL